MAACLVLGASCQDASKPSEPDSRPRTGGIRVSVSMSGEDFPQTFTALVAGRLASFSVTGSVPESLAGSVIVDSLAPEQYTVMLRIALNCAVKGENPRSVRVNAGDTTSVAFTVTCIVATGTLHVTTVTTGVDLDETGYVLRVDGHSVSGASVQQIWRIDANETATLTRVPVIGSTDLTLYGMAVNCNPSDSTRRRVSMSPGDTMAFTFTVACTPATDSVAYVADYSGGRQVFIASANGSGPRRLTTDFTSDDEPAWSPDGTQMAFVTDRDGNREIYVIGADGSNPRRLTDDRTADYAPAWSPDGKRIAFVSERDGNPEIYVMNADGTSAARLTTTDGVDADPAWSPDGRITFASDRNGRATGTMDVYVMSADGSNPARLTTNGGTHPAWSRDGRLAYSAPDCDNFACRPSIVVRSGDGTDDRFVFGLGDRPSWSPDGRKIAFEALRCDFYFYTCAPSGVRVGRLDSTDLVPLAAGTHPAWRP